MMDRTTMSHEAAACQALWRAVLGAAARDYLVQRPTLDRWLAEQWLDSGDFHRVCELASVPGDRLARALRARRTANQAAPRVGPRRTDPGRTRAVAA